MVMFFPSTQPSSRSPCRNASRNRSVSEGVLAPRKPIRWTDPDCCATAINGAIVRLRARTTASPIRRIGHLDGMAGGSLADDGCSQELAALVKHGLLNNLVRSQQQRLGDRQAERLGGLE